MSEMFWIAVVVNMAFDAAFFWWGYARGRASVQ